MIKYLIYIQNKMLYIHIRADSFLQNLLYINIKDNEYHNYLILLSL
jgi:hypothetical protein